MLIDSAAQREALRLTALDDLGILDTPPDAEFDALARAASLVCGVPISLISLLGEQRQWFKASVGLPGVSETPRSIAFCAQTVVHNDLLEIPDATVHPTFANNPLVTGDTHVRFYAGVPLRLPDGNVVGTLCVIDREPRQLDATQRDILRCLAEIASVALQNWRERRIAADQAEALRISEEFLDCTNRIAGVGGWELNLMSGRLLWSAETRRIHGVAADHQPTLGEAIAFYPPESRAAIQAAVTSAAEGYGGWDIEVPFIRADGAHLCVRLVGAATMVDGVATRVSGAFQNVTERVAQRTALRQACERERVMIQNSPDVVFTVAVGPASDCRFESFNPSLARITGWDQENLIGRPAAACLPEPMAGTLEAAYASCLAQPGTVPLKIDCATPLGRREFEGWLRPIPEEDGSVARLTGVLRDRTEHNRMQAELHHRQKIDTIGRLAAGVAHDFNNILQSITSSLELVLSEARSDTPTHDIASVGLRSAERGAYLTHHLLSYARKQVARPSMVDLGMLLSDMRKLLSRTLGPHISVLLKIEQNLPPLYLDPSQLQTALLNLGINAGHAMPHAGTITLSARVLHRDGATWIAIVVADNGSGMDAATLVQAGEPFFTTKGLSGTGLGLSMVRGFVDQSGGTFHIRSVLGSGTEIELQLPATASLSLADLPTIHCDAVAPCSMLLVDDDDEVLATTAAFLIKEGYDVHRAASAAEALALLSSGVQVDVVMTDYAMPGLSGVDLIARARTTLPHLPAVIITGFSDLTVNGSPDNHTVILRKPFRLSELIGALSEVMAHTPELATADH